MKNYIIVLILISVLNLSCKAQTIIALDGTNTFNKLFPIGSNDRDRILTINSAEDTNQTLTQGGHTAYPKSNPC